MLVGTGKRDFTAKAVLGGRRDYAIYGDGGAASAKRETEHASREARQCGGVTIGRCGAVANKSVKRTCVIVTPGIRAFALYNNTETAAGCEMT